MTDALQLFHFLRPLWLFALPLIAWIWWQQRRGEARDLPGDVLIAPHLRDALTVNKTVRGRIQPVDGMALALLAIALAAAGPTWSKIPSPWFAETAPLVIAVEVSDSMRSNDLQPTRMDRARFKILDLIARRTGARSALIAYSGTAHVVMPPTTDAEVIKPFLESLDPAMMPSPGANAAAVLPLAQRLMGNESALGTLLFVTDGFEAQDIGALAGFGAQAGAPRMAALIIGTDAGGVALLPDGSAARGRDGGRLDTRIDGGLLDRVTREAGVAMVRARTGDGDLDQLMRLIQSNLAQADDPLARWDDRGPWLLWPAALLVLLAFRRGWVVARRPSRVDTLGVR
jgi:Ca-activated chloride channel family protein